jgi:hypothetical protein
VAKPLYNMKEYHITTAKKIQSVPRGLSGSFKYLVNRHLNVRDPVRATMLTPPHPREVQKFLLTTLARLGDKIACG